MARYSKVLATLLCATGLFAAASANATLVNNANGTFTDTTSGYVWKTLSQFNNMNYNTAVASLSPGFHAASATELATLTTDDPAIPANFTADYNAMGASSTRGLIWGFFGNGTEWAWKFSYDTTWYTNDSTANGWASLNYAVSPSSAYSDLGLFAVNTGATTSVPEPTSLAILGLGLVGLVGFRRKSRNAK